ncbi:hypothetical protein PSTG_06813 [Puccinia striiformis f. sp. tritici PST-78]|uniref:Uncharacterized protein n=1 Tax=Puccinia striiformis f. sp. tritici PST-78 TaxID=1165861 RepID=A0A0L0VL90_9BASI|nr:hypothetical protein PSTG_06813 [Puccinia striiformis f. sp. tritici PST-78]
MQRPGRPRASDTGKKYQGRPKRVRKKRNGEISPYPHAKAGAETSPSTYHQVLPDHPSATKKTQGRKPAATKATKPAAKKPTKLVARKPRKPAACKKNVTNNQPAIQSDTDIEVENNNLPAIQTDSDDELGIQSSVYDYVQILSFLESVVSECKDQVKNTGSIVSDSLNTRKPVIKWSIIIPRVTGFKKDDGATVHNEVSFTIWITALAKSNATKPPLNLSMINPTKVTKKLNQAQLLAKAVLHKKVAQDKAEAKEARTAKHRATNRGTDDKNDDDDDDKEDDENGVDDVKFHMREIYKFA